jgi:hypothetical protein
MFGLEVAGGVIREEQETRAYHVPWCIDELARIEYGVVVDSLGRPTVGG